MDKSSKSSKDKPSVRKAMTHRLANLTGLQNHDVPPQPSFYIDLCIAKEDMPAVKEKPTVSAPSSVADSNHLKSCGFVDGVNTQIFIRNKKVKDPGKSTYALGRSWLKAGRTLKDEVEAIILLTSKFDRSERASMDTNKDKGKKPAFIDLDSDTEEEDTDDDADDLDAKILLQEFVNGAKARKRMAKLKGKKVVNWGPRRKRKHMLGPKMKSLKEINLSLDKRRSDK